MLLPTSLLVFLNVLASGFTVGVTLWLFFVQSPFLFQLLGKERFVPIMMPLTRLWVTTIFFSSTASLFMTLLLLHEISAIPPTIGWLASAINKFVVVPAALKAGARSHASRKGDHNRDVKEFVVEGGGKSETKTLHQTVVVFVLIMTGSFLWHLWDLVHV